MSFVVDHIAFSYPDHPVLTDVSLTIDSGHFYGILGPNGCGKSTLIDLLMGHQRPNSGRITYHERNVHAYSRRRLAREMALVPQNFYVNFPFTALEVVLMGRYPHLPRFAAPSAEDAAIIEAVMERTGTARFRNRYMTEMSGGERQRVIFARALAQDTPVLLLDEATSNMDIHHTLALMEIVATDVKDAGKTAVSVFQDVNLAATYCDRLILMKNGTIADWGETGSVLTADNLGIVFDVDAHVYSDAFTRSRKVSFRQRHAIHS